MSPSFVLVLAAAIGVATGLRTMGPLAVITWAVHLGWLDLHGSPLRYLGATAAVAIVSLFAAGELVIDKLPSTPSRTNPGGLVPRCLVGGLAGATLAVAGAQAWVPGAVLGAVGGLAGAFAGYQARVRLVRALEVPDLVIALLEDLCTIGGSLFIVSRF